ncbi:MAG: CopG family ribbon-helix-helix protein [Candidatus Micrarchaeia archaeon]
MAIISVSIDHETLSELTAIEKSLGFSGRSEAIRAGVRSLISENKSTEKLSGKIKAVLLLVHEEGADSCANELKHSYDDVVGTQIHSNLRKGKCMELFILEGEAARIRDMLKKAQSSRKIEYAKLIVP